MFKVGDAVFNKTKGLGKVVRVEDESEYDFPVFVEWRDGSYDTFTMGGLFHANCSDPELDLYHYNDNARLEARIEYLEKEVERLSVIIKGVSNV